MSDSAWSRVDIKVADSNAQLSGWSNGPFIVYERAYKFDDKADYVTYLIHRRSGFALDQFVDVIDAVLAAEIAVPLADWDWELANVRSKDEAGARFYDKLAGWPFFTIETPAGFHVRSHNDRASGRVPAFPPHFESGRLTA